VAGARACIKEDSWGGGGGGSMVMLRNSDEENGKLLCIILLSKSGFTPTLMHNITYYLQLRENYSLSFRNYLYYGGL
jgi:hypothetical protein